MAVLANLKTKWRRDVKREAEQSHALRPSRLLRVHLSEDRVDGCSDYICHTENASLQMLLFDLVQSFKVVLHEIGL